MSLAACADLVRRGDPDRFLAAMAAPLAAREVLFPLYAFNLEVARAPWVTAEPLIAEMRLQWWRDVLAEIASGAPPRAHEVVGPLAGVMARGVPADLLDGMVAARRWDIAREGFPDMGALIAHLDRTGGSLMWASALALGAEAGAEPLVRGVGRAAALASWLGAVAALEAAGRTPLPEGDPEAITALARDGLGWLQEARASRGRVPARVRPALYPAWQAGGLLKRVVRDPMMVRDGRLALPEVVRRGGLLWTALTGRW
jgi:phytoene/squalene synthetase